ncbi:hypothetical protein KY342_04495 [Candidatus Woesearchaeota archaeon]|nr:hypothetical protein [Candidatus Woesearchaeota archaeon]
MDLLEVIDVLEQESDSVLPKGQTKVNTDFSFDDEMFSKMANFIINLDPDNLSDDQVQEIINMIEKLEIENDDVSEVRNPRLAKRTLQTKNQASKKWYRKNRTQIKRRKAKMRRSSEGRKRLKAKERLASQGKTPTGRRKVRYHRRKRSDRDNKE